MFSTEAEMEVSQSVWWASSPSTADTFRIHTSLSPSVLKAGESWDCSSNSRAMRTFRGKGREEIVWTSVGYRIKSWSDFLTWEDSVRSGTARRESGISGDFLCLSPGSCRLLEFRLNLTQSASPDGVLGKALFP